MGTGKLSIGIPRKGGHVLSWPSDSHLVCSAPGALLEELLEEIEATHFGPGQIRCSVAWQHIDWEPQPPVMDVLYPEETKGKREE
jgi:hypothetical protein